MKLRHYAAMIGIMLLVFAVVIKNDKNRPVILTFENALPLLASSPVKEKFFLRNPKIPTPDETYKQVVGVSGGICSSADNPVICVILNVEAPNNSTFGVTYQVRPEVLTNFGNLLKKRAMGLPPIMMFTPIFFEKYLQHPIESAYIHANETSCDASITYADKTPSKCIAPMGAVAIAMVYAKDEIPLFIKPSLVKKLSAPQKHSIPEIKQKNRLEV